MLATRLFQGLKTACNFTRTGRDVGRAACRRPLTHRLRFESLEDRRLLAIIGIDATALTAPQFSIPGVAGSLDAAVVQNIDLLPGDYSFRDTSLNEFAFAVGSDGNIGYDAALEPFLDGAGTADLTVNSALTIDATSLTAPWFRFVAPTNRHAVFPVDGLDSSVVQDIGLIPGEYEFQDTSLNEFTFTVGVDPTLGTVFNYDAALEGFLTGADSADLTVNLALTIDATSLTAPWFRFVAPTNRHAVFPVDGLDSSVVQDIGLIPGEYEFQDTSYNEFTFTVGVDPTLGTVFNYDAALEPFLDGAGTANLTLHSAMTIDATSLTAPWFRFHTPGSGLWAVFPDPPLDSSVIQDIGLIPGEYEFQDTSYNKFTFTVDIDPILGTVFGYDAALEGFLTGADSADLTLHSALTIDATSLTAPWFRFHTPGSGLWAVFPDPPLDSSVVQGIGLIPGEYEFQDTSYNEFTFTVGFDPTLGTVFGYDAALEGFLDGAGTADLVLNSAMTIDATSLTAPWFRFHTPGSGLWAVFPDPPLDSSVVQDIGLIPGEYEFQDTSLNEFAFTVGSDGLFWDLPASFLGEPVSGNGTTRITIGVQEVLIDVKPGSDLNPINLANMGVIPVAILTTDSFDASLVDATTVVFAGAYAVHSALEDTDGDGDLDLILHFETQQTNLADLYARLVADDLNGDGILDSNHQTTAVSLTGQTVTDEYFEAFDGVDLFLSGKNLRDFLEDLATASVI